MALGVSYRDEPFPAYWGIPDSVLNFFEEDYILSPYIAEVINTVTNIVYVSYALNGIWNNLGRKDAFLRNLPYLGIASVGIGSMVFHSTNRFFTQWADDLSMLVATATVLHRVFTFDTSATYTAVFGVLLSTALSAFAVWHCWADETHFHSILFGIMIIIVGHKTNLVIKTRITDPYVRSEVTRLARWGLGIFATGYGLWNIDEHFCPLLTSYKRTIGMPWSFLLELHGWWHLFTGIGAYIFIALVEYLTSEEAGKSLHGRFAWPVSLFLTDPAREPQERAKIAAQEAEKIKQK